MDVSCLNAGFIQQTQQIAKKTQVSSAGPIKFIITKTVNSKGLTAQTSVSPVIAGISTSVHKTLKHLLLLYDICS